jgi:hypothetical protein
MKKLLGIIVLSLFIPTYALAGCSEPRAPSAPSTYSKPSKPSVPFCVNEFSNTHTCDDWTINSYNSDLDRYRDEVDDYQSSLQSFVNDSGGFAREALDYANCEIRNLD